MEYATNICTEVCNNKFMQHVGFDYSLCSDKCSQTCLEKFFSIENRRKISLKITELLEGVRSDNKKIIVADDVICSVMSNVYDNFRPETGDIYSRYNIPANRNIDWMERMTYETINIITSDIGTSTEMIENNKKLTIWTTVLGDFNEHGLRSHPVIKLKERRASPFLFNMNY